MSGFGIDFTQLMASCEWSAQMAKKSKAANEPSLSWVAGLICRTFVIANVTMKFVTVHIPMVLYQIDTLFGVIFLAPH